jgi:chromosome segregation ATPase
MSFPPIPTTKFNPTAFARLPLTLTDSDAVPRETKFPVSRLKSPLAGSLELQERMKNNREQDKERAKQVEALRCENNDLKQQVEDLQMQVFDMRVKAATAPLPAEKVQMIDQEVQATEGDLTEHIAQLREEMRELRMEKKTLQAHVSQQQDALSTLSRASAHDNAAACMDFYMSAMEVTQEL